MIPEPKKLSLTHRSRPARSTTPESSLLILLHGYGSNEDDLFGLAPYFDPRLAIVSARAPVTLGMGSYAWFPIGFDGDSVVADPGDAARAAPMLAEFVQQAGYVHGASPDRTFVAGFSQGATMAGALLMTHPELIGGAVMMSGFLAPEMVTQPDVSERLRGKPVLVTHGLLDRVVPVQWGRAARDLLQSLGVALEYHEYPMAHELSEACIEDVDRWLVERLDAR